MLCRGHVGTQPIPREGRWVTLFFQDRIALFPTQRFSVCILETWTLLRHWPLQGFFVGIAGASFGPRTADFLQAFVQLALMVSHPHFPPDPAATTKMLLYPFLQKHQLKSLLSPGSRYGSRSSSWLC